MLAQLRKFWTNLSPVAKAVYGATAALLVAAVAGIGYWSSQVPYQILATNLDPVVAGQITSKFDADRISYRLSNHGTTISVPTDKYDKVKMNLAVAGLPSGNSKGYELFDSMSMGTTPFVQNINFVRAKEGELVKTIMQLGPVESARVHLAFPDPTPFIRDEKPVTAAIEVKTKPGVVLSRQQVAGIVRLTAGSVTGLTAENVTVIDSDGQVISEKHDSRNQMVSNEQLAYQREVETNAIDKAQDILAKVLGGHGRAVVRVTADMSFRHLRENSEKFDPEGRVAVSEQEMTSKTTAMGGPKGVTGGTSNIPPSPSPTPGAPGPKSEEESRESLYAVSRVNLEKEEQQDSVDRLTIAVMLIPPKGSSEDFEEAMGITQDDVELLVKNAVGFKESRGDQIKVSIGKAPVEPAVDAVKEASDEPVATAPFLFGQDYVTVVRGASLVAAGMIALAMVVNLLRRKPKAAPSPAPAFATAAVAEPAAYDDLSDLHAVAATIKAWLEEPAVVRFERSNFPNTTPPQAKPA